MIEEWKMGHGVLLWKRKCMHRRTSCGVSFSNEVTIKS
jgi:hypothetical protein